MHKSQKVTFEIGTRLRDVERLFAYATYGALKSKKKAARVLGITLKTLKSKIRDTETIG